MTKAFYITAAELAQKGKDNIPDELLSAKHLIYSSPATLAFNSPGAQGFGVKRAGLCCHDESLTLSSAACTIPTYICLRYRKPWRRYVKALITLPRR